MKWPIVPVCKRGVVASTPRYTFETTEVSVTPLTREQYIELAARRTGTAQEWLRQQADDLLSDTGGNPNFVEQLISGFAPQTKTLRSKPRIRLGFPGKGRGDAVVTSDSKTLRQVSLAGSLAAIGLNHTAKPLPTDRVFKTDSLPFRSRF